MDESKQHKQGGGGGGGGGTDSSLLDRGHESTLSITAAQSWG